MTSPGTGAPVAASSDGNTAETASPPAWRMGVVAGITLVALIALMASPWRSAFAFVYMGVVPAVMAMMVSARVTALSAIVTGTAVFLGVLVSDSTVLAVLWMAALSIGVAAASRIGGAVIAAMIAAQSAIVAVSGNVFTKAGSPFDEPHSAAGAVPPALFALAGGLVVAFGAVLTLRGYGRAPTPRLDLSRAAWFGATLVPLTILGTWACMHYFRGTHAWWLLLTIYIVLLPTPTEAVTRMRQRTVGTILGAAVVIAVVSVVDEHVVFYVLALVAALGTIATTGRSYTLNVTFLTCTVLFAASPTAKYGLLLHYERIGLTALGALLAFGLMTFNLHLRHRLARRHEAAEAATADTTGSGGDSGGSARG